MIWEIGYLSIRIYIYIKNYSYRDDLENNWKKTDFFHEAVKTYFKINLKTDEVDSYLTH